MNHLQFITDTAKAHPDGQVIFDEPLNVKSSPHRLLFTAYGLCVGPGGVYLLDGGGDWHGPLLESQTNAGLLIASIYQRLRLMQL